MVNAHNTTSERKDYSSVSPTALVVAYFRRFSDIPHSSFIAEFFGAKNATLSLFKALGEGSPEEMMKKMMWFAPVVENRFKMIDWAIKQSGMKNVVCVAEGISPRPYNLTAEPKMRVVATDLPGMAENQSSLIKALSERDGVKRDNLFVRAVDVVYDLPELRKAVELATQNGGGFVMCNEGLISYLSREHQRVWFQNAHEVCAERDGIYITTDIRTKNELERMFKHNPNLFKTIKAFSGVTDSDLMNNAFDSKDQAIQMAYDAGWSSVEIVRPYQRGRNYNVASLDKLKLSEGDRTRIKAMLERAEVWIFQP